MRGTETERGPGPGPGAEPEPKRDVMPSPLFGVLSSFISTTFLGAFQSARARLPPQPLSDQIHILWKDCRSPDCRAGVRKYLALEPSPPFPHVGAGGVIRNSGNSNYRVRRFSFRSATLPVRFSINCVGVRGRKGLNVYLPYGTRHLDIVTTFPPPSPIPPSIYSRGQLPAFNLSPLIETSHNDKSLSSSSSSSSIMSLLALILEALAGTVTLLSTPILLDRVLTHLCALPFLSP